MAAEDLQVAGFVHYMMSMMFVLRHEKTCYCMCKKQGKDQLCHREA